MPGTGVSVPPVLVPLPDAGERLTALAARVRRERALLDYPLMDWVTPVTHASGTHVHDVLILGAGQGGLATAFGLMRERVTNILVLDRAEPGREGPWITYARMLTFRSPKHVTGPDLGVPALTPQAWFQAVFGPAGWEAITRWPRALWQDYLVWYRAALDLPVRNRTEITAIAPDGDLLRVSATDTATGEPLAFLARKIVLATGIEGNGDWRLPALALDRLPKDRFAHTNWEFDVGALRGKRVGVLGAGASAFDTAASALEAGAVRVHQFARRPALPLKDPYRTMEKSGFLRHFGSMTAPERWRWLVATRDQGVPATQDGIDRCTAFPNYRITTGAGWAKVAFADGDVIVTGTDGAEHRFDFLVLGTGYAVDLTKRPELSALVPVIALWRDRFVPPAGEGGAVLDTPWLGDDLSFTEKVPGTAPWVRNIHNFTAAARVSIGSSATALTSLKYAVPRLVDGLTRFFWLAQAERELAAIRAYADIDLDLAPLAPHRVPAARQP